MPKRRTPESYVSEAALEYLGYMPDVFSMRVNSGMVIGKTFDGRPINMKLAKAGTADILALVPHHDHLFTVLWCETKAGKNGLRSAQKDFRDEVEAKGHVYLIVREIEDLQRWFNQHRSK